jgi:hypothetical protein
MAQYKANCTSLKKELAAIITQVTGYVKQTTGKQQTACKTLLTALNACKTAINKCDPNCSCKGKTPTAGMQCFAGPVTKVNAAIDAFNKAMSASG